MTFVGIWCFINKTENNSSAAHVVFTDVSLKTAALYKPSVHVFPSRQAERARFSLSTNRACTFFPLYKPSVHASHSLQTERARFSLSTSRACTLFNLHPPQTDARLKLFKPANKN